MPPWEASRVPWEGLPENTPLLITQTLYQLPRQIFPDTPLWAPLLQQERAVDSDSAPRVNIPGRWGVRMRPLGAVGRGNPLCM